MKSIWSINSGEGNKMFCLYHTFDEYSSYGMYEKTVHITNLSTDYDKAVIVAKSLYKSHADRFSKLYIPLEWKLEEITRDGIDDQVAKTVIRQNDEPKVSYPTSSHVGAVGEIISLTLGVTDSFYFDGSFGSTLCTKFVDQSHNIYSTYSSAKFIRELTVGDTIYCTAEVSSHSNYQEEKTTTIKKLKGAN
tara:strand:+ start:224 stop:796 length:573 start_codon:yes stop_codon:yes gene_type:complete